MACTLMGAKRVLVAGGLALAGLGSLTGCGSDPEDPEPSGAAGSSAGSGAAAGAGGSPAAAGSGGSAQLSAGAGGTGEEQCENIITEYPPASANHVASCSALTFDSNPPAGGDHYAVWAAFQSYDFPVPAGFLVHALEHGAIVYWYNCPEGCADEVVRAQAMIDALPIDVDRCTGTSSQRRVILVPSPELDVRWAASSWGYVIKSSCFDAAALRTFYVDHYGRGREDTCNDGQAFASNPCP